MATNDFDRVAAVLAPGFVLAFAGATSDVSVTDGVATGRALSFFTIDSGRISRIVEFWPEPFPASPDRAHLVERLQ